MTERRITKQTERILALLLTNPTHEWWGAQMAPATGMKSGTLYPALARMERFGWLSSRWEEVEPSEEGRPRRRYYKLTGEGERVAHEVLSQARSRERRAPRRSTWSPTPHEGRA